MEPGSKDRDPEVVGRLCASERKEDLRKLIREIGLWRLPIQRRLGERYQVSQQQISKDLKHICTTLDKNKVDEIFTEFYFADQKLQNEIRKILNEGTTEEKLRAGSVMIQLEKSFTEMLEKYGKKKIIDKNEPSQVESIRFEIIEPKSINPEAEGKQKEQDSDATGQSQEQKNENN